MRSADEQNRLYFRQAYATGQHGWAEEPSPHVEESLSIVAAHAGAGRLLDLGCGEGRHCLLAAQMGFSPVGVDYEPGAIRRAQEHARKAGLQNAVKFLVADVFALPFGPGEFDMLLDHGCLHHQKKSDWPRYLSSILRVLRPHGHFLLSVFSTHFRVYGPQERPWHLAHGAYRRFFTGQDLRGLFGREFEFLSLEEERDEPRGFWHALMRRK